MDHHVVVEQAREGPREALGRVLDRVDALAGLRVGVDGVQVLAVVAELPVQRRHPDARVALQRVLEVLP
ncbi:MAG: hypothetical protein ACK559_04240, partial [bacterium]